MKSEDKYFQFYYRPILRSSKYSNSKSDVKGDIDIHYELIDLEEKRGYRFKVTRQIHNDVIQSLLDSGRARERIVVSCISTGFREELEIGESNGMLWIPVDSVAEAIEFRSWVEVTEEIVEYINEFQTLSGKVHLERGDAIAVYPVVAFSMNKASKSLFTVKRTKRGKVPRVIINRTGVAEIEIPNNDYDICSKLDEKSQLYIHANWITSALIVAFMSNDISDTQLGQLLMARLEKNEAIDEVSLPCETTEAAFQYAYLLIPSLDYFFPNNYDQNEGSE